MRWSQSYIPTLKEAPADAEVASHKLMLRAGMIRKLAAGLYSYLPFGWKAISKVAAIVREEMNRAGAQELLLPSVQPADLWVETGRWQHYGKELLRFKDRHDRDYCFGPTHEEVITDLVRGEVRSYRQLPLSLYQIQTKFRDEIRPRFGLMRGREFLMKDAYSFDRDDAGADKSYQKMYDAYTRIFTRLGLNFRAVEADSGSIGGNFSHEFMVLAKTGEDVLVTCTACAYAANQERAIARADIEKDDTIPPPFEEIFTPAQHTVADITEFMQISARHLVKTILLDVDGKAVAALVRGDRELNEIKLKNYLNAQEVRLATPEQVTQWSKAPVGFAGPVALKVETVLADLELQEREGWVTGANKKDTHLQYVSLGRDAKITAYTDLRTITEGDICEYCGKPMTTIRGIEVGHVFKLGTKYSACMNATYLDENGKEQTILMGCYGIGVTRIVAAAIEQNHDEKGIIFPPALAPVDVLLICLDPKKPEVSTEADAIYLALQDKGLDVLYDDREERPGVKFNDAELIGIPLQLIIGGKGLANGIIEAKDRRTGHNVQLPLNDFATAFDTWQEQALAGWKTP